MNFEQLLESGQIVEAFDLKLTVLEEEAAEYRGDIDLYKGTSLALTAFSVLFSLTPIGLAALTLGSLSYVTACYMDMAKIKKLYPLPGVRHTVGEMFAGVMDDEERTALDADLIRETVAFLDRAEAWEYELLVQFQEHMLPLLLQVPSGSRELAYRVLLRHIKSRGAVPTMGTLSDLLSAQAVLSAPVAAIAPTVLDAPQSPQAPSPVDDAIEVSVVPEPAPAQPAAPVPITPASTPAPVATTAPPAAPAPPPKPGFDIPTLIAKEQFLLSRIWIGPSRTGKSYAVAATQRKVKAKYKKKLTTYVLSGVDRPNEYFYWDECDRVIRFALDSSTDEHAITSAYESWHKCLTEWTAIPSSPENPKLLIVDEASLMALKAKTLSIPAGISYWRAIKDRAVSLSSAGSAAGAAIWLITPNGAMGALEFAQHEVGAFNPVFITRTEASAWNETVYITARRNGLTPAQPPSDALRRDAMMKGCDRLAGIGGRWLPYAASSLGQLPPSKPTAPPPPPAPPTPPAVEPEAFVLPEDADLFDDLFEAQPTPAEKFLKWLEGKGQATIEQVKSWTVRIDGKPQKLPAQQLKEMLVQLREAGKIKTLKTPEGNIIQLVKTAALS